MKNIKKKIIPVERYIYEFRGFTNYNRAKDDRADAGTVVRPVWLKDKENKKKK